MASNYGDLSRQLELCVQTFILFFFFLSCFLTDNGTEKRKGSFKRSLRRGGRRGKYDVSGERSGCLANENSSRPSLLVLSGGGLRGGRSLQVKFQLGGIAAAAE